jgi:DNA-binding transcriptional regulator YiaG
MTPAEIRKARLVLGLTQKEFGDMLHASLKAVQAWEYGQRNMTSATEELLKIKMNTERS